MTVKVNVKIWFKEIIVFVIMDVEAQKCVSKHGATSFSNVTTMLIDEVHDRYFSLKYEITFLF